MNPEYLRRLADGVNAAAATVGGDSVSVLATPAGQTIVNRRERIVTEISFGTVTNVGPAGEEDFDDGDPRFWVIRKLPTVTDSLLPQVDLTDDDSPDGDKTVDGAGEYQDDTIVVATDLFGTEPTTGDEVILIGVLSREAAGGMRKSYVILKPGTAGTGAPVVRMKIRAAAAGKGMYWGRIMSLPETITAIEQDDDIGVPMMGEAAIADVLVLNAAELENTGAHWIDTTRADVYFPAWELQTNPEGATYEGKVYWFHGVQSGACT